MNEDCVAAYPTNENQSSSNQNQYAPTPLPKIGKFVWYKNTLWLIIEVYYSTDRYTLMNRNGMRHKVNRHDLINEAIVPEDAKDWTWKPKPKYVPYNVHTFRDVRNCWFKINDTLRKCTAYDDHGPIFSPITYTWQTLLDHVTFEDDSPCGVKQ